MSELEEIKPLRVFINNDGEKIILRRVIDVGNLYVGLNLYFMFESFDKPNGEETRFMCNYNTLNEYQKHIPNESEWYFYSVRSRVNLGAEKIKQKYNLIEDRFYVANNGGIYKFFDVNFVPPFHSPKGYKYFMFYDMKNEYIQFD